jgi:hypothetical protein
MGTGEIRTFVVWLPNSTASGVWIIRHGCVWRGKMELWTSWGMTLILSARMCCTEAAQMTGKYFIISTTTTNLYRFNFQRDCVIKWPEFYGWRRDVAVSVLRLGRPQESSSWQPSSSEISACLSYRSRRSFKPVEWNIDKFIRASTNF